MSKIPVTIEVDSDDVDKLMEWAKVFEGKFYTYQFAEERVAKLVVDALKAKQDVAVQPK